MKDIAIFESLDTQTLNTLLQHCPIQEVSEGNVIIVKGQRNSNLYLLLSGRLSVHIQSTTDSPIAIPGVGEIVGELSYIDSAPATAFVMAQTDSRILVIDREFVSNSPPIANAISKHLLMTITNRGREERRLIFQDREQLRKNLIALKRERESLACSQRELAEKSELLERTLKMMSQGISIFDSNLNLVAYNQRFLELLELPSELVHVGSSFEDIVRYNVKRGEYGDEDVETIVNKWLVRAKKFEPHEFIRERPDGAVIRVQGNPVRKGGWYATYTDITEQVRAIKLAERASQAKSQLLAKVSHEMRTPLNPIINYARLIRKEGNLTVKQKRDLHDIETAGKALLQHITKLLDWSKTEEGKMELNNVDFDLVELLRGVSSLFSVSAKAKGLELRLDNCCGEQAFVHGDKGKLRDVLNNLLDNAVKYTERGEIHLRTSMLQGDWYHIEVEDSGRGIPTDVQKTLFHPYQMTEAGLEIGGWGLGLHLTKKNVDLMRGNLQVESTPNAGSCFTLRIPLPTAKGRVERRKPRDRQPICLTANAKVSALIVDDEKLNQQLLCRILHKAGVETHSAASGQEALQMLHNIMPSIVFLDIQMPAMNGYATLQAIRGVLGNARPKIVAISATSERSRAHYLHEGFDDFIPKPFHRLAVVYDCIHRLLGVEFKYDDPRTPMSHETSLLPKRQDIILPKSLAAHLKEATQLGRIDDIENTLKELECIGPDHKALAGHFRIYTLQFDLPGLQHELDKDIGTPH